MMNAETTISISTGDGATPHLPLSMVREALDQVRRAPKTKPDPDFAAAAATAYRVTADELRQFVERAEQLAAEKRDIAEQEKEVFAEAMGRGYDTKVLRKIIALRKRKPDEIAEEEAVLDLYKAALGMV
jgi:uncharacterized protein (UPF0335 family)